MSERKAPVSSDQVVQMSHGSGLTLPSLLSALDEAGVGIWLLDLQGKTLEVNDALAVRLGLPRQTLIGANGFDLVHPDIRERTRMHLASLVRGERQKLEGELSLRRADDTWLHVEGAAVRIEGELTTPPRILVIMRDFTEGKPAREKIREHTAMLMKTARVSSIGVVASGIVHEINQPLNGIMLSADTLRHLASKKALDQQAVLEAVGYIIAGVEHISEVLQHLRAYWVDAVDEPSDEVADLNHALSSALSLTRQRAIGHGIKLEVLLEEAALPVVGPGVWLEHIAINLLTTAVESCDASGKKNKQLIVRTRRTGEIALLTVQDNGTALPSLDPERLFDPFFTSDREVGGIGLYLSIARMFATKLGGHISVERTASDDGTVYSCSLPMRAVGDAAQGGRS